MVFMLTFPRIAKLLKIKFIDDEQVLFFRSIVLDTIAIREKKSFIRPDMIQLLMEARKGEFRYDNLLTSPKHFSTLEETSKETILKNTFYWEDDDLTAQCFAFYFAGFDVSATVMSFTAYELTINPDIQHNLIAEIDEILEELGSRPLTYDALQKMKYMNMVICGMHLKT